jgi:LysR family transcriptional regulator, glycine cleavage system transcriptional activator
MVTLGAGMIPIKAIFVFHTAARLNSVTKAGEVLGVTPSAVSQQIRSLEMLLGTSLLAKKGRQIQLTEAGERYFQSIADEIDRIAEATDGIRGIKRITVLNVRATPSLSTKWLLPRLSSFIEAHPQFDLRLDGTNEPTNFQLEDVDVEIRHGEGDWPGVFVEPVATETFLPVCRPDYAAAGSLTANDLGDHRLIQSVKSQLQWPRWFQLAGAEMKPSVRRTYFDRSHMAVDAAANGMGIALESNLMMEREMASGALVVPVAAPPVITLQTQWIVCPRDHLQRSRVCQFLDWLRAEAARWQTAVDHATF